MPYSIQWEGKKVFCKFTGEVTGQELFECNMAMYGNSAFDSVRMQIFDMLEATEITFTLKDVKKVAAFDRAAAKINPRMKCALVSTDQTAQELSKIYQDEIQESPWEGKAFHTLKEALEWVSRPGTNTM
jgi:hypothetical protein